MIKRRTYLISILVGLLATAVVVGMTPITSQAVTKISFWHAMGAKRMPAVNRIVDGFNATHPDTKVEPQFSGKYKEVLAKTIAAARGGNPPHIAQVYEVGTQTMLDSDVIVPVHELFKPGEVDYCDVVGPIRDYIPLKASSTQCPSTPSRQYCTLTRICLERQDSTPTSRPLPTRTSRG